MAGRRARKARNIGIGIVVMLIVVAIPLAILSRYAGEWGVPYFSFSSDRGATCTNDFIGYHCEDLTVSDLRWWGELPLPDSTTVLDSYYKATHDFLLKAEVEVPAEDRKQTYQALRKRFGDCRPGHPTSLDTEGLKKVCVMANNPADAMQRTGPMTNTLYVITTGRQAGGSMLVGIYEESR